MSASLASSWATSVISSSSSSSYNLSLASNDSSASMTSLTSSTLLDPPTDHEHCSLLGPVGLLVQGLMGVLVLATLLVKRSIEHPKRPWKIWMADTSKQFIGQAIVHTSNILISTFPGSSHPHPPPPSSSNILLPALLAPPAPTVISVHPPNPCSLYFLNVLIDTTLGVLIIMFFLRLARYVLVDRLQLEGWQSGVYSNKSPSDPSSEPAEGRSGGAGEEAEGLLSSSKGEKVRIRWSWWAKQTAVYVLALVVMKGVVIVIFALLPVIFAFGSWVLAWLGPKGQIVFVMAIFPLVMNVFQFLALDTILKYSTPTSSSISPSASHDPTSSSSYAPIPSSDSHPHSSSSPRLPDHHFQNHDDPSSYSRTSATDTPRSRRGSSSSGAHPKMLRNRSSSILDLVGARVAAEEEEESKVLVEGEERDGDEESRVGLSKSLKRGEADLH